MRWNRNGRTHRTKEELATRPDRTATEVKRQFLFAVLIVDIIVSGQIVPPVSLPLLDQVIQRQLLRLPEKLMIPLCLLEFRIEIPLFIKG